MLSCNLATLSDNTPENTERVKHMINNFCASNPSVDPDELHEIWQGFTCGNTSTPEFWLVRDEESLIGFMVTHVVNFESKDGIEIMYGYLDKKYASLPSLSRACMNQVEQLAKANDFEFVMCCTELNPTVYGRWVGKAGYTRAYTAFVKRI